MNKGGLIILERSMGSLTTDNSGEILKAQFGKINFVDNQTTTYVPCFIQNPQMLNMRAMNAAGVTALTTPVACDLVLAAKTSGVDWVKNTAYIVNDIVEDALNAGKCYICVVAHTSTNADSGFATDLAAGKWVELSGMKGFLTITLADPGGSGQIAYEITGY